VEVDMVRSLTLLLAALTLAAIPAQAQFGGLRRAAERAKQKVEQKVDDKVDRKVDEKIDRALGDEGTPQAAAASPAGSAAASAPASPTAAPGEGAWANYDFVPGERPIYVNDFSADRVGDFPRRMTFKSGNMQIVEWQGQRWLSAEGGELLITLPETLPERYTMEFDLAGHGNAMQINFGKDAANEEPYVEVGADFARLRSGDVDARGSFPTNTGTVPVKIRIAVDGDYLKLYANEQRVLNVPNAKLGRSGKIFVLMNGWSATEPRMIANLRVAAGGRAMYDALMSDGRVATQGILFDTGSDRIRPESTPTLKEMVAMLREHADLKLAIEGHTDNVGDAAANQTLSEKRAAAVRAYLVGQGIDESRLRSAGYGASKPAAPNDTSEGRQRNRRVELVKM
jgi:outer membrane protein OmpA-like peptidoglycan-associated protein